MLPSTERGVGTRFKNTRGLPGVGKAVVRGGPIILVPIFKKARLVLRRSSLLLNSFV
ncbi:transcription factor gamyb [Phtheirospermum japonicum]|uniref:Transcription factor gamyb n=1 Tax=Phtheirospermum japonicum TaxID=374723 RepID=A0A830D6H9_9LAMI|nr:transcription factor gamyb [Phtheirospermum japonicum]